MILLDTNVLVALVDERDHLHGRAKRDLGKLAGPFGVLSVVLAEACFLLEEGYLRGRLSMLLERLPAVPTEPEAPWWADVFAWLDDYADQSPDLCDALLVTLAHRSQARVWTYDSEFVKVWRLPGGKRVPTITASRR
jgi:predicted nucleic acid-binding protein